MLLNLWPIESGLGQHSDPESSAPQIVDLGASGKIYVTTKMKSRGSRIRDEVVMAVYDMYARPPSFQGFPSLPTLPRLSDQRNFTFPPLSIHQRSHTYANSPTHLPLLIMLAKRKGLVHLAGVINLASTYITKRHSFSHALEYRKNACYNLG
jgi:hypothetical protein